MITIIEARLEHIDGISELWKQLMDIHIKLDDKFFSLEHKSYEDYNTGIKSKIIHSTNNNKVFVALSDEIVVGYVTVDINPIWVSYYNYDPICEIGDIMINERFHNLGIGERFIQEVILIAKKQNVNKIMLNVFSKNTNAYFYFKHLGFQDTFNNLTLEIK